MTTLLLIPIPENVPLPRYRLWQHVVCYPGDAVLEVAGYIVGLKYDGQWRYHVEVDEGIPSQRVDPCPVVVEEEIQLTDPD